MRKKSFYDSEPGHWSATNPRACRVSGSPWPCGPASRSSASSWSPTASVPSTPTWGPKANSTAARGRISAITTHVSGRSPFQPVTQVVFFWRFLKNVSYDANSFLSTFANKTCIRPANEMPWNEIKSALVLLGHDVSPLWHHNGSLYLTVISSWLVATPSTTLLFSNWTSLFLSSFKRVEIHAF